MVVLPAPSKPRINILISLDPNKDEKIDENTPPVGKDTEGMMSYHNRSSIHALYTYWSTFAESQGHTNK